MRVGHFSDTHLGYRNYSRQTPAGINQREHDVFVAFKSCLEDILRHDPDVILHTGDLFHTIRPGNHTLIAAHRELTRVQAARKGRPFVIVAGNHETPNNVDAGCILRLFNDATGSVGIPGVYVADLTLGAIDLSDFDISVYCVPSNRMAELPQYAPAPNRAFKTNIVAAHGLASSVVPSGDTFDLKHLKPDKWDYLALGDYHIHKAIADNAVYSGSTEFTTTNIWEEAGIEKGWVLFDSDSRKWKFHPIATPRRVVDLPEIDADGLGPAEIVEAMLKAASWSEDELPIVRQRVVKVAPAARADMKTGELRAIHEKALYYKPEFIFAASQSTSSAGLGGGRSLKDNWNEFAGARELPRSIDRNEYVTSGVALLDEVSHASEED